jgi:phage terminase large subunit
MLFGEDSQVTEQGRKTLAVLDRLTGVRKDRLRYGRWVQAEGVVYEGFDRAIHVIDPFPIPASWRRVRSIDFGYTNPFTCQWWAFDGDKRLFLYREIYMTKRTVRVHAGLIKGLSEGERFDYTIADHDAEDRATLSENGIPVIAAIKDLSPGLQAVEERLKVQGDGRPRLFVFNDALVERDEELAEAKRPTCTAGEFECYVWEKGIDGRPTKERPVKEHDHGMDALRYVAMFEDRHAKLHTIAGAVAVPVQHRSPLLNSTARGPLQTDPNAEWNRVGIYDEDRVRAQRRLSEFRAERRRNFYGR